MIMGNGPTLLKSDIAGLAGDVTIVSNAHYLIWDKLPYTPTYLTVEDRLVAEDRASELRDLANTVTVFPFDLRELLGPATPGRIYINLQRRYVPVPSFTRNVARRVFWGGTVSFVNLQLAWFLGCRPIVLIGFDHAYTLPDRKSGPVITSVTKDVNHIHPDYFGPGYRWHDPNVARMEEAYRCAAEALTTRGVPVVNATCGGHLEVFPRMEPTGLTGACK